MPSDPLLRPLEDMLNRNIAGSARAQKLLAQVAGQALEIRLATTPLKLQCSAADGRLQLGQREAPANVIIEGSPLSLARMAAADPLAPMRQGQVRIVGDAEVAQAFQQLLKAAQPDLEEELARVTGDAMAHHMARAARYMLAFGQRALETFARNSAEYLTEEGRDLPSMPEAEAFLRDVDALREATDRLEARLAVLERRGRPA